MNWLEQFKAARRAAVPIIIIECAEYASVMSVIMASIDAPILSWDVVRGVNGINESGKANAGRFCAAGGVTQSAAMKTGNPVDALSIAVPVMEGGAILFMANLQMWFGLPDGSKNAIIQAVANVRDAFKINKRTLVLLCQGMKPPAELANDVITIDVPLPNETELTQIIKEVHVAGGLPEPLEGILGNAINAVSGLSSFAAEQVASMCLRKEGLILEEMWARKKSIIKQQSGLDAPDNPSSFESIGGLASIVDYGRLILGGKRRPKLCVLIDEVDKQMAGLGDSNGINADTLGVLLSSIQDNGWDGFVLPGFPGTGKTEFAKAMGKEAGGLFLTMDLGAAKGKFVGDSEQAIRGAVKVLKAMGGDRVLFVMTCNDMSSIRPELLSRMQYGTYFFDVPSEEEKLPIWKIHMKKYGLMEQDIPQTPDWTGREIAAACRRADEFSLSLVQVAPRIVSAVKNMGTRKADALRRQASDGQWLSANTGRPYARRRDPRAVARAIENSAGDN